MKYNLFYTQWSGIGFTQNGLIGENTIAYCKQLKESIYLSRSDAVQKTNPYFPKG